MDEISGYIERITFHNPENGYTIARLQEKGKHELTTIVGVIPAAQVGETLRCWGSFKQHLIHGRQFTVDRYRIEAPADLLGIEKYLGSGLIKGIGPTFAKRIVEAFGVETLEIIDRSPDALFQIEGIGKKRVHLIIECWKDQRAIREVMVFLQGYGISPTFAQKIFKKYGDASIKVVKDNPYTLANDLWGIGFKSADKIAKEMGIVNDAPKRIEAGIEYHLAQLASEGNVCYPLADFSCAAAQLMSVSESSISPIIEQLAAGQRVSIAEIESNGIKGPFIWVRPLFLAESGIARELKRIKFSECALRAVDRDKAIAWVQQKLGIELAEKQKLAVKKSLSEKFHIITGGPGTGKSTITNAILHITEMLTRKLVLAAPTGRAAKRMSEITKRKASTIHSLLEFDFTAGGFKRNSSNPIDCDLIIIDEASMIDTQLMYALLKAIPSHARVLLVGDIHQLPSVGPGNVLKDMIASHCVPKTLLKEIFRQAAGSRIITNAHRINNGVMPETKTYSNSDFFFIEEEEPEEIRSQIITLVKDRLPKKYGFNCFQDIQLLAPMKKGVIGTESLNEALQESLNPCKNPLYRSGKKLGTQDKVMQIRNNYQKEVFNGDVGYIAHIDAINQSVTIDFEGRLVAYDFSDLDEIVLAYAVSIHKYQGSECPCIIIPVHTTHFKLLHRNLLYTGVTRGKKLVILIGTKKALAIAVNNDEVKTRYTGLQYTLMHRVQAEAFVS